MQRPNNEFKYFLIRSHFLTAGISFVLGTKTPYQWFDELPPGVRVGVVMTLGLFYLYVFIRHVKKEWPDLFTDHS